MLRWEKKKRGWSSNGLNVACVNTVLSPKPKQQSVKASKTLEQRESTSLPVFSEKSDFPYSLRSSFLTRQLGSDEIWGHHHPFNKPIAECLTRTWPFKEENGIEEIEKTLVTRSFILLSSFWAWTRRSNLSSRYEKSNKLSYVPKEESQFLVAFVQ